MFRMRDKQVLLLNGISKYLMFMYFSSVNMVFLLTAVDLFNNISRSVGVMISLNAMVLKRTAFSRHIKPKKGNNKLADVCILSLCA